MKFHLISDLHVEFDRTHQLDLPGGETLLLAGDLCEVGALNPRYELDTVFNVLTKEEDLEFHKLRAEVKNKHAEDLLSKVKAQLSRYNRVYAVLGNHEHYNCNLDLTAKLYREILPEVTLLDDEFVPLSDKIVLFGSTLWTDLDKGNPLVESRATAWSDYASIRAGYSNRRLKTSDTLTAHKKAISALYKCIGDNPDKDIIVMTHFVPSSKSVHERFRMSLDNWFFYSSLEEIMLDHPNIKVWCHGHTHNTYDYMMGGCRVICNPRGYVQGFRQEKTGFNPNFTFEL